MANSRHVSAIHHTLDLRFSRHVASDDVASFTYLTLAAGYTPRRERAAPQPTDPTEAPTQTVHSESEIVRMHTAARKQLGSGGGVILSGKLAVGPSGPYERWGRVVTCCSPRHPSHFQPSVLGLTGLL